MPFGLLGLAVGIALHQAGLGVALLAWAVASRLALSIAVGDWVVGDRSWFALLVLYPIRDLMGFGFWAASYLSNKILWRGRVFELLPGGKMRAAK
jgi:ceramide glucosyltransferase